MTLYGSDGKPLGGQHGDGADRRHVVHGLPDWLAGAFYAQDRNVCILNVKPAAEATAELVRLALQANLPPHVFALWRQIKVPVLSFALELTPAELRVVIQALELVEEAATAAANLLDVPPTTGD